MKNLNTSPTPKLTTLVRYCISELIEADKKNHSHIVIKWMHRAGLKGYTSTGFMRIFNSQPEVKN